MGSGEYSEETGERERERERDVGAGRGVTGSAFQAGW